MELDQDACYTAVTTRDPRFDGWFFSGVRTTGIYCRPSCPARTPLRGNVRFYPTSAAAQLAGFRACRRCRPDAVPGSPAYDHAAHVAARAVRLVDDGYVERHGIEGLSDRLGYSSRQLNRILTGELGAGPLQLARARRAHTARILAQTTELSFADVAFAAGFGSIRQFNDTVREVFGCTPGELRARRGGSGRPGRPVDTHPGLRLRLAYREPFDAHDLWAFLASRLIPGLEEIVDGTYRRVLSLPGGAGIVELTPRSGFVEAHLELTDLRDLSAAVARCRRLLDLDADPIGRAQVFEHDPVLGPLTGRFAGLRLPGSTNTYETAVRAVLGQQVSVAAAARLAGLLVARAGTPVEDAGGSLTHAFPSPDAVLASEPLPMPGSRNRTLQALTAGVADGTVPLHPAATFEATAAALARLPGIGAWTLDYTRLRALGDPDAFPAGDLVLRREAGRLGLPSTTRELTAHATRWTPLRSWAAQLLWTNSRYEPARQAETGVAS